MPARVPLDVDMEDRLLYGLTPIRLAYAVGALLGAFAIWSSPWGPAALRAAAAFLTIVVGAVLSWGTWHGSQADAWVAGLASFGVRTRRLSWTGPKVWR